MLAHDEVCGMSIDAETAAATFDFQGKTYYFCTERCQRMFVAHPERFVPVREDEESERLVGDHSCH
jgi:YHS domain-containing protein